jgi:hypothetical protein
MVKEVRLLLQQYCYRSSNCHVAFEPADMKMQCLLTSIASVVLVAACALASTSPG